MELGFLEDEFEDGGLLIRNVSSEWVDWDGGLAGGKEPIWLAPPVQSTKALVQCARCHKPLTFLLQIYAPLDEFPQAFHRDLCVYFCARCPVSPTESALCIRSQLAEANAHYPSDSDEVTHDWPIPDRSKWAAFDQNDPNVLSLTKRYSLLVETVEEREVKVEEDEDHDDDEDDGMLRKGPQPCEICKTPTSTRCSACKSCFYCTREHQAEHWTKGGHKSKCKDLQDALVTQKELDASAAMGDARTQSRLEKDAVFDRFVAQTKPNPDQVLRYRRWKDGTEIWTAKTHRLEETPPACEHCGAERKVEFQITPQFLNHFEADLSYLSSLNCDIDFGTICVYTCTQSCPASEEGACLKEFAYCQPATSLTT